jgi:hypothetical protein
MSKLIQILDAIDPKTIAKNIVLPCKMAEQTYKPKHLVPDSYEEFLEDCAAYWIHLCRTYYGAQNAMIPSDYAGGIALSYIDQAFRDKGGTRWAYEKAKEGMTFGVAKSGITEAFLSEAVSNYTGWIVRSMVNPYDYNELVSLMKEYVQRFVTKDISQGEFQMMISNYSMILRSHVQHHADMAFERQTGIRA